MRKKLKVIDLGLRDSMSASQILAEASKWNWNSFVLMGWVSEDDPDPEPPEEDDTEPKKTERLMIQYHPDTNLEEVIVLAEIVKDDALEGLKEEL